MDKDYTILHISDLHKSEEDSYKDLMESLCMDCETYEREGIKKLEIIVVSGDIAEGAEGSGTDRYLFQIEYEQLDNKEVKECLGKLENHQELVYIT